jgi:hypothetical protein
MLHRGAAKFSNSTLCSVELMQHKGVTQQVLKRILNDGKKNLAIKVQRYDTYWIGVGFAFAGWIIFAMPG